MASVTRRPLDSIPPDSWLPDSTVSQPAPSSQLLCRSVLSPEVNGSILLVYTKRGIVSSTAKLFKNGRSQAVRLPREFRFEGDRVRVRRAGRGVLVEPVVTAVAAWFDELDRLASEPFMPEGRQQPPTPERDVFE